MNLVFLLQDLFLIKVKEPSLPYYLPLAVGRREFISFPSALVQREMQTASSKILTQIDNSISYNNGLIWFDNVQLQNRIEPKIDNILRKNQNGFRRNRSTISQILTIRRILEGV